MDADLTDNPKSLRDLLDQESIQEAEKLRKSWSDRASALLESEYRPFYAQTLEVHPQVRKWRDAMENHRWSEARTSNLWRALIDEGFVMFERSSYAPARFVGDMSVISPRVCDVIVEDNRPTVNFAFSVVRVCLRVEAKTPPGLTIPTGWTQCRLIDCELFEIPHQSTSDIFDDREKIHVVYLAGMHDGILRFQPCYIGVGTGEAYGVGPRRRTTMGRFRFYRYDIKDNFQCEHINAEIEKTWQAKAVATIPNVTDISDAHAVLLDARSVVDSSFVCLSDPVILRAYEAWLKNHPVNEMEFRQIRLHKMHHDLRTGAPSIAYDANDVDAVLQNAQQIYRWFACAWLHAARLTAEDGVGLYFRELPEYKRSFYGTMKVRREYAPLEAGQLRSVIDVLRDEDTLSELTTRFPPAIEILNNWWREQVVKDLYASGGHPELRLQTAILTWQRMRESGWWGRALEHAYNSRLTELEFGPTAVIES